MGDLNYIPMFLYFVMKIPKNSNLWGLEISAFLEIFLLEDLVVLKGQIFGGPMDQSFVRTAVMSSHPKYVLPVGCPWALW